MIDAHLVSSILFGTVAGIFYGLFFVATRKRALDSLSRATTRIAYLQTLSFVVLRIVVTAFIGYHLLRLPFVNFILLIITFLGFFWLTLFFTIKKV